MVVGVDAGVVVVGVDVGVVAINSHPLQHQVMSPPSLACGP